ncbi:dienelactone hydrolase family protein [Paucibacter soli]|uniref:dienelactone hydrolase family protein n=1 Tax=Paucibacter soli TaxID=3133433 RepID=UPI0030949748
MRAIHQVLLAAMLSAATIACAAAPAVRVSVPSLEQHRGQALPLSGHWYAAEAAGRRPAVLLLHGCGGPYNGRGELSRRMRDYSALLNEQGWHVLVLDSLSTRGERELCTQRIGTRAVTMANRRLDALGALAWLGQRADVDASRLALIGWSNGGSTVLASSNLAHAEVAQAQPRPRALVAFYPGCEAELRRGYQPSAPLQLLVGAADDWTPAQPCEALAAAAAAAVAAPPAQIAIESYAGAYHGFDSQAPVKLRKDVPNGVHPGQGVHVGGNAAALAASRERLLAFLKAQLQ